MLTVTSSGILRRTHEVTRAGAVLAHITEARKEEATFELSGARFTIQRPRQKQFELLANGAVQASALSRSGWKQRWEIAYVPGPLELRRPSAWRSDWELVHGESPLGGIEWQGFFGKKVHIELDEQLPVQFQLFVYYIAEITRRRSAAAASSGGG